PPHPPARGPRSITRLTVHQLRNRHCFIQRNSSMPAKRLTQAFLVLAALRVSSAFATEWDGGQSDFFNPASWSPPVVPGPSETALFDKGGVVSFSDDASTLNAIVSGSPLTLSITPALGLPPGPLPHQPRTYTLTGTAADTLSVSTALTISGG